MDVTPPSAVLAQAAWAVPPLLGSIVYALLVRALTPASTYTIAHSLTGVAYWKPSEMFDAATNHTTIKWANGSRAQRLQQSKLLDLHTKHAHNLTKDLERFYYETSGMHAHALLREPFATASCAAFWVHGLAIAALAAGAARRRAPFGSGGGGGGGGGGAKARVAAVAAAGASHARSPRRAGASPPSRVPAALGGVLASLLCLLGGGSACLHLGGSLHGSWEHHLDRVTMFAALLAIAVAAAHAAVVAVWLPAGTPRAARRRRALRAAATALALTVASLALPLNRALVGGATPLLGGCGLTAGAALGAALVAQGARGGVGVAAAAAAASELVGWLLALAAGAVFLNTRFWMAQKRRAQADPYLLDAERVAAQATADWAHGAWHHQSALLLACLCRIALEAAATDGRGGALAAGRDGARALRARSAAERPTLAAWAAAAFALYALGTASVPPDARATPAAWAAAVAGFGLLAAALAWRAAARGGGGAAAAARARGGVRRQGLELIAATDDRGGAANGVADAEAGTAGSGRGDADDNGADEGDSSAESDDDDDAEEDEPIDGPSAADRR